MLLWPDETLQRLHRPARKEFSLAERKYFLNAVRYVSKVIEADGAASFDTLPKNLHTGIWLDCKTTSMSRDCKLWQKIKSTTACLRTTN